MLPIFLPSLEYAFQSCTKSSWSVEKRPIAKLLMTCFQRRQVGGIDLALFFIPHRTSGTPGLYNKMLADTAPVFQKGKSGIDCIMLHA